MATVQVPRCSGTISWDPHDNAVRQGSCMTLIFRAKSWSQSHPLTSEWVTGGAIGMKGKYLHDK